MAKCIFCGTECVSHSEKDIKEIGGKLANSKNNLLAIFYQHVFKYCPNCNMVEIELNEDGKNLIKKNKAKMLEVLNNKAFNDVDKNKFIVQAEAQGYACEILGDDVGAFLGYKACSDLLGLYIEDFIETMTNNVLQKNGEMVKFLNDKDYSTFEYAQKHKEIMDKLVNGKYNEKTVNALGYVGIMVYLDSLLDVVKGFVEKDIALAGKMLDMVNDVINRMKENKIDEKYELALEQIQNKFLLINKTFKEK